MRQIAAGFENHGAGVDHDRQPCRIDIRADEDEPGSDRRWNEPRRGCNNCVAFAFPRRNRLPGPLGAAFPFNRPPDGVEVVAEQDGRHGQAAAQVILAAAGADPFIQRFAGEQKRQLFRTEEEDAAGEFEAAVEFQQQLAQVRIAPHQKVPCGLTQGNSGAVLFDEAIGGVYPRRSPGFAWVLECRGNLRPPRLGQLQFLGTAVAELFEKRR